MLPCFVTPTVKDFLSASHTVTDIETSKTELIYGSFILVGTSEFDTEYHSLDDDLIDKYMDLFSK